MAKGKGCGEEVVVLFSALVVETAVLVELVEKEEEDEAAAVVVVVVAGVVEEKEEAMADDGREEEDDEDDKEDLILASTFFCSRSLSSCRYSREGVTGCDARFRVAASKCRGLNLPEHVLIVLFGRHFATGLSCSTSWSKKRRVKGRALLRMNIHTSKHEEHHHTSLYFV